MINFFEIIGDIVCQLVDLSWRFIWSNFFGLFWITVLLGFLGSFGYLVYRDHQLDKPADGTDYAKLQAYPNTCATHTTKIRIEDWLKSDPNFVLKKRHVVRTLIDCKEYDEAITKRAGQQIFMR